MGEDLEVTVDLDLHLTVLECPLMALEEDMEELAHTAMVVQVPFTGCQDSEGRVDIMLLLQPMVGSLLLMVLRNLLMALNLLLMMHLLHKLNLNQAMVLVQGQPMMHLLQHMHLLPTAFLLTMVVSLLLMELMSLHMVLSHPLMVLSHLHMAPNLLHMAHNLEVSSNLEVLSSNLPLYLRLYQLDQCNLCKPKIFLHN